MALRQQQRLFQRREAVGLTRKSLAQRHSEQAGLWLGRAEFDELSRPPLAGRAEASRPDLKATVTPVLATVGPGELVGSDVGAEAQSRTQVPQRPLLTSIPPHSADVPPRPRRSRRFTRLAAAGALALVGVAASVPLITSHGGSIAAPAVGKPAPVAATPALDPGTSTPGEDSSGAPAAAPNKPADGPAPSAAAVRAPHTIRNTSRSRTPVIMMAPPAPRTPVIPARAYAAWSRMAALSARDQDRAPFRPEAPPRP